MNDGKHTHVLGNQVASKRGQVGSKVKKMWSVETAVFSWVAKEGGTRARVGGCQAAGLAPLRVPKWNPMKLEYCE